MADMKREEKSKRTRKLLGMLKERGPKNMNEDQPFEVDMELMEPSKKDKLKSKKALKKLGHV